MNPDTTRTVIVCHSNRSMTRLAQLNASRHGIRVIVARDGAEVLVKARGDVRPDAIVLSNDLKNPSTDELVKMLNADPILKGCRVVVLKSMLGNLLEVLKGFKMPPPRPMR